MAASTDTIFARASGAGRAGVSVFRVSGPDARRIVSELVGKRTINRQAHYAEIRDPKSGSLIDRGLVILFEKPASFTGEDVAEFHLHGSRSVEAALFETLKNIGARPAEAGEFTLRALRNEKLDLTQVEALADLLDSETTPQRMQALGQLDGRLSALAEGWRARLLATLTPLEADIDFPDEGDVPAAIAARAAPAIGDLKNELTKFILESGRARMIREGIDIAIIGPPNAGKSSLVNALAGTDVAIVSDTPGTTRDVIEARLDLGGIVAVVADTAGLRDAGSDQVEAEGMARARARAERSDRRIAVIDPTSSYVSRETLSYLKRGDILAWSRADLTPALPQDMAPPGVVELSISPKTGAGIERLVAILTDDVSRETLGDGPALTRERHVQAAEAAIEALNRAEDRIASAPELAAEDVRIAARALGGITGAVGVEDVLGEIFSSFCIGK